MKLKSSLGFTLIELVIVLVLLSIVAATAIPKFINLSSDAKISALDSIAGAVLSADSIVMSKAKLNGIKSSNQTINIPGTELYILGEHMSIIPEHLHNAMQIDGFFVTQYLPYLAMSTFIYLADEQLPVSQIRSSPCYIQLSLTYHQDSNQVVTYPGFNIHKFYDGC